MSSADLTARARIREAAVAVCAEKGIAKATIRQIAERAGVSPALVIHHFGTKDGLLAACDEWMHGIITREKAILVSGGNLAALHGYLDEHPEYVPLLGYLNAALREGGEPATRIFDLMCEATKEILGAGIAAGTVRQPTDMDATIALMVAYSSGVGLLGEQIAHRLGGDGLFHPTVYERYARAALELFTYGTFTSDDLLVQHEQRPPAADHHPTEDQQHPTQHPHHAIKDQR